MIERRVNWGWPPLGTLELRGKVVTGLTPCIPSGELGEQGTISAEDNQPK